ncbi:hypothetical protein E1295_32300 [Nonomuraea mesophila]|uniref:Uncharacterized protein n=1 Tax=Nonomuraea mesophila TaxID=2530382 RepID=A0A4R5EYP2_9ACTN|nr:hypothetical protein E1295_32300 [Nonomuraea mesophila]
MRGIAHRAGSGAPEWGPARARCQERRDHWRKKRGCAAGRAWPKRWRPASPSGRSARGSWSRPGRCPRRTCRRA